MGAASSVDLHAELARPADASDVETNDEARAEVARLRAMIATQLAAGAIPSSRMGDKLSEKACAELFLAHGVASVEDLVSKWEEGFNEVYCSIAFIPQMDNEKGKALLALARGNIDRAMLEKLVLVEEGTAQGQIVRQIDTNALSAVGTNQLLHPLNVLVCHPHLCTTRNNQ